MGEKKGKTASGALLKASEGLKLLLQSSLALPFLFFFSRRTKFALSSSYVPFPWVVSCFFLEGDVARNYAHGVGLSRYFNRLLGKGAADADGLKLYYY